jgi:hypothetical protein
MRRHKTTTGLLPLLLLSALLLSGLLPGVGGLPGLGSVAWAEIRQPVAQLNLWNRGECTRINDSSFSVPDTARNVAIYRAGVPMRYGDTWGTWRYGLITAVVDAGATLTVTIGSGAAMDAAHDAWCEYGSETLLHAEILAIPGTFADSADAALLLHDLLLIAPPHKGLVRYLLQVCVKPIADDTGAAQPAVTPYIAGVAASSALTVSDAAWVCTSTATIDPAQYDQQNGEAWEIGSDAAGTNDDARDLTVLLVWLQEV